MFKVAEATLGTEYDDAPHCEIQSDTKGTEPPDDGVANQVDLTVVLHPEVLRAQLVQYRKVGG